MRGERLGPLHGLPTGIKDLHETEGLLTTYGSPLYRDFVPKADAAMVALVRKAGAIIVAKTNVPEFGAGANTRNPVWGATGNPFDPTLNAGGSSGGSAVALACDMLPVCTGSDTGGSLRIPAAMCGVVGFRPSPGVVPMDMRGLGWTPISVLGPMGRTVADTRLLLSAQVGMDDRDPLAFPLSPDEVEPCSPRRPRRAARRLDRGFRPMPGRARRSARSCAHRIAAMRHLFRSCDEVRFDFGEADRCFDVVRAQNFVAALPGSLREGPRLARAQRPRQLRDGREDDARRRGLGACRADAHLPPLPGRLSATTIWCCRRPRRCRRFPWTQLYLAELEGSKLRNYYHWLALTYFITLVTNPAISLPCGVDQQGMPFGLQVAGRFRGDVELLDAAEAMEQAFAGIPALRRPRPDIAKLKATPYPDLKSIVTHPPVLE